MIGAGWAGTKQRSRLLVLATAVLFSTGGAAIKACSLQAWQVASLRSGVAAISLWILLPKARRGWTPLTWLVAIAYAATLILFVLANKLTTSANAIFLQSTSPLYLLLIGPLVLREPVRRVDLLLVAAVVVGAGLLFLGADPAVTTAPDPARGNMFAALSGLTYALTIAGLRFAGRRDPDGDAGAATAIAGNLVAFAVALPFAWPLSPVSLVNGSVLLYLGVVQIGLAYIALTRSVRHVTGLEASTLLLVEPVFNPIWSWLVHHEEPSALALAGGAMIIFVTLAATWWRSRTVAASL